MGTAGDFCRGSGSHTPWSVSRPDLPDQMAACPCGIARPHPHLSAPIRPCPPDRPTPEAGFALPFTIFLVTIVTILLAAAFTRATSEHMIARGSDVSLTALSVAQSGLQSFFGDTFSVRPPEGDSIRYNVANGYAWVYPQVMLRPADTLDNFTYIVRAEGFVIHPNQGSTPVANRTVAQFARWQTGHMDVDGLLVVPNGIVSQGGSPSVAINGNDLCSPPDTSIYSIRAPIADSIPFGVEIDTISGTLTSTRQIGWPQPVALGTGVNWNQIVSGDFIPDHTSIQLGDGDYTSQLVVGDATIANGFGTGLLIVTGDLTFNGATAQWDGVILVGGQVDFNAGFSVVFGAIVTGLSEQVSISPAASEIGGPGNDATLQYASCRIHQALKSLTGFVPIQNARIDNWATY